ncbi:MAG: hypothetical protein H7Y88_10410 [Phycisphaerales bacterium]|nr:hypothetical protein [Phycisphaerales bacterium]
MSAYGLWDVSGGASEWTEEVLWPGFQYNRVLGGSYAGDSNYLINDHVSGVTSLDPSIGASNAGLRIASIPEPSIVCAPLLACAIFRRRR